MARKRSLLISTREFTYNRIKTNKEATMKHEVCRTLISLVSVIGTAGLLLMGAGGARASVITWTGAASTDFEASGNWSGTTTPPTDNATTDTATFSGDPTGINQPSLTLATRSVLGVNFVTAGWTLSGTGLELKVGGTGVDSAGAGVNVVSANLTHTSYPTYTIGADNTLELSGAVAANKLTKRGAGTLILSGSSANTTDLYANEGLVKLNKTVGVNAMGTHLNINGTIGNGSTVLWQAGQQIPDNRTITMVGGLADLNGFNEQINSVVVTDGTIQTGTGTLTITRSADTSGAFQVASNATQTARISGKIDMISANDKMRLDIGNGSAGIDLEISAVISDSAAVKGLEMGDYAQAGAGTGTLCLSGTNTYRKATQIHAGRLVVDGRIGDPAANTVDTVTADAGTTLGGTGTILANTTVNGTMSPGSVDNSSGLSTLGTLTIGSVSESSTLTLGAGATVKMQFGNPGQSDALAILGNLVIGSGTILDLGNVTPEIGTYTILTYTGSKSGDFTVTPPTWTKVKYEGKSLVVIVTPPATLVIIK